MESWIDDQFNCIVGISALIPPPCFYFDGQLTVQYQWRKSFLMHLCLF